MKCSRTTFPQYENTHCYQDEQRSRLARGIEYWDIHLTSNSHALMP